MDTSGARTAVVLAAGHGRRMMRDKALLPLGDESAVARCVRQLRAAGCSRIVIVRRPDAASVDVGETAEVVTVDSAEMIVTLRAGLEALGPDDRDTVGFTVVLAVDHAMVRTETLRTLVGAAAAASSSYEIVLPLCRQRPGHPVLLGRQARAEVLDGAETLRDVIRRDPDRVLAVPVTDGWCLRDLDVPADWHAAQGYLESARLPAAELMAAHRSRRRFQDRPVGDAQLRWLIDSARYASTSSYGQSYSVIAVRDADRREQIATFCSGQAQIREAPLFLAICADLHKIAAACARHGGALDTDPLEVFVQATVDAALFGQNLQLAAESEGLGGCMIGAARNEPVALAELLDLPPAVYVVFGMTLGWPAEEPEPRGRMTLDAVLHDERYDRDPDHLDGWLEDADEHMREWARAVNRARSPSDPGKPVDATRGWTQRMWWLWGRGEPPKGRANLLADLRRLGFDLEARAAGSSDGRTGADED